MDNDNKILDKKEKNTESSVSNITKDSSENITLKEKSNLKESNISKTQSETTKRKFTPSGDIDKTIKDEIVDRKKIPNSKDKKLDKQQTENGERNVKQSKNSKHNPSNNKNFAEENEFIEKLVSINRVAKVVKGGRRFSFAALVVVGDGNGMVGHGKGKAKEVPEAIKKATDEAKSRMIRVPLRQARTLHHDITGRYDAGRVKLRTAPSGTGVIAGGPMRSVFEALGIKDIVAKSIGSSNPHNMIRATFDALKSASSPKLISIRRGLKVNEITKRRNISSVSQEVNDA